MPNRQVIRIRPITSPAISQTLMLCDFSYTRFGRLRLPEGWQLCRDDLGQSLIKDPQGHTRVRLKKSFTRRLKDIYLVTELCRRYKIQPSVDSTPANPRWSVYDWANPRPVIMICGSPEEAEQELQKVAPNWRSHMAWDD